MDVKSGWLERSLERARTNVQARPEHLKPQRYRAVKTSTNTSHKKNGRTARAK